MILGLDFTTHNDDTLRADEGQVQDDTKNNDITEEDDDCMLRCFKNFLSLTLMRL